MNALKTIGLPIAFVSFLALTACDKGSVELKTDDQKASYAVGQQIGNSLKQQGVQLDASIIGASINDVLQNKESRLKPEDMQNAMRAMQTKMMSKSQEDGKANKEKGDKYLEENKKKPNVKTTASGLQYEALTEGKGDSPKDTDQVKVNYRGTLIDGTEFDSSYKRKEPATFPVMAVIPGWTEALKLMTPGSKYKLVIPSNLAYGEQGRPGIPPNSVLNFEVELLEVKPGDANPHGMPPKGKPGKIAPKVEAKAKPVKADEKTKSVE